MSIKKALGKEDNFADAPLEIEWFAPFFPPASHTGGQTPLPARGRAEREQRSDWLEASGRHGDGDARAGGEVRTRAAHKAGREGGGAEMGEVCEKMETIHHRGTLHK